jgi:hypothetical protein
MFGLRSHPCPTCEATQLAGNIFIFLAICLFLCYSPITYDQLQFETDHTAICTSAAEKRRTPESARSSQKATEQYLQSLQEEPTTANKR